MDDVKKWQVTYTKHIKQKRKVYHDGFLHLHSSNHKVKLYDECDKLLEEDVVSGETLTFQSYIVEVGDPEGERKLLSDTNLKRQDSNSSGSSKIPRAKKFRSPISAENQRIDLEKNGTPPNNLSVSHRLIREFKKTELHKYTAIKSSSDATKSSVAEWQALYTTQLTQKAKKYHDDFLHLTNGGSQGGQMMLYDETGNLINSQFLKKDEMIKSGESLRFDSHLVDIGEPVNDCSSSVEHNIQRRHSTTTGEREKLHGEQNCPDANKFVERKWDALYTSQVTQKSKKYHNGIVRLTQIGSRLMQVTLFNEDGTTLITKHLKLSEQISRGSKLGLPGYLVEVCEPLTVLHATGSANKVYYKAMILKNKYTCFEKGEDLRVFTSCLDGNRSRKNASVSKPPTHGDTGHDTCLVKGQDLKFVPSGVDESRSRKNFPAKKSVRDVSEILSILKTSVNKESIAVTRKIPLESSIGSEFLNLVNSDTRDQQEEHTASESEDMSILELSDDELKDAVKGNSTGDAYQNEIAGYYMKSDAPNFGPKFDETRSMEKLQLPESVSLYINQDSQSPKESRQHNEPNGIGNVGCSGPIESSCRSSHFSTNADTSGSFKDVNITTFGSTSPDDHGNCEKEKSEEHKSSESYYMDEDDCPRFDLGF